MFRACGRADESNCDHCNEQQNILESLQSQLAVYASHGPPLPKPIGRIASQRQICSRMTSTARSSVYHDVSGATEHAPPPRRIALDGNSYTEEKFAEWYGKEYRHMWDSASPSGQEPQRGAETADAVAADEQTAGAAEHNVPAVQFADKVQEVQKPYPRRARLVNKRLSVADAVLSQQADREAKFKRLISDVSTSLIDEFIDEELR